MVATGTNCRDARHPFDHRGGMAIVPRFHLPVDHRYCVPGTRHVRSQSARAGVILAWRDCDYLIQTRDFDGLEAILDRPVAKLTPKV